MSPKIGNVENQYAKNRQLKKDDIVLLQSWLEKQPHLPHVSEIELINFLHSCYYSLEQAKQTIDAFFSIRTEFPHVFGQQDDKAFNTALDDAVYGVLQNLTLEGNAIIMAKMKKCNSKTFSVECHVKYFSYSLLIHLLEKGPSEGVVIVVDMDGISWDIIIKVPLSVYKAFFRYLEEALPVRLNQLHFINSPSYMDKFMALIKPCLKLDLLSKTCIHTKNLETLYPYVPLKCLPSNYGGSHISLDEFHKNVKDLILSNSKFIEEDEIRRTDENKRQGKTINTNVLYGMEGSFKKLEID